MPNSGLLFGGICWGHEARGGSRTRRTARRGRSSAGRSTWLVARSRKWRRSSRPGTRWKRLGTTVRAFTITVHAVQRLPGKQLPAVRPRARRLRHRGGRGGAGARDDAVAALVRVGGRHRGSGVRNGGSKGLREKKFRLLTACSEETYNENRGGEDGELGEHACLEESLND